MQQLNTTDLPIDTLAGEGLACWVKNQFNPVRDSVQVRVKPGQSVNDIIAEHAWEFDLPTICLIDGQPVLRAQWDEPVPPNSSVVMLSMLQDSDTAGAVLVVVGAFVSTLGPLGATIGRGLMVAGASLLVAGALAPTPKRPQTVESDPTYSLSSGANPARIREPIPVLYGTVMMTPDLAAKSYSMYVNNEQYLYTLYSLGQGYVNVDTTSGADIYFDDTPINAFWLSTAKQAELQAKYDSLVSQYNTALAEFNAGATTTVTAKSCTSGRNAYCTEMTRVVPKWSDGSGSLLSGDYQMWSTFADYEPVGKVTYSGGTKSITALKAARDAALVALNDYVAKHEDVLVSLYHPGEEVTLFPSNLYVSGDVVQQEITDAWSGGTNGFPAQAVGATELGKTFVIDINARLYTTNDNGGLDAASLSFEVQWNYATGANAPVDQNWKVAYLVNDAGVGVSSPTVTLSNNKIEPIRKSYVFSTAATPVAARVVFRIRRTAPKNTNIKVTNDLYWIGLRTVGPVKSYDHITTLAIRMKATDRAQQLGGSRMRCKATRLKDTPLGTTYTSQQSYWFAGSSQTKTVTRYNRDPLTNTTDVVQDILKNMTYGGRLLDANMDLTGLTLNVKQFNGVFSSSGTVWDALRQVASMCRMRPYVRGTVVNFSYDQQATLPVCLFTARNIVADSFKVTYQLPNPWQQDGIEAEYLDSQTWKSSTVTITKDLDVNTYPLRPSKMNLLGVTDRNEAQDVIRYFAAAAKYRRKLVSFSTEMEGFIPGIGDTVAISHDVPGWGISGEVRSFDGTNFVLSEPVAYNAPLGTPIIKFRNRDGSGTANFPVSYISPDGLTVQITGSFTPESDLRYEATTFIFGYSSKLPQMVKVTRVAPRDEYTVDIEGFGDDPAFYSALSGSAPPALPVYVPDSVPDVTDLDYSVSRQPGYTTLTVNWTRVTDYDGCTVLVSYFDTAAQAWQPWKNLGITSATSYSFDVLQGFNQLRVRVLPFRGARVGDWDEITVNLNQMSSLPAPSFTESIYDVTNWVTSTDGVVTPRITVNWAAQTGAQGYQLFWRHSSGITSGTIDVASTTYTLSPALATGTYQFYLLSIDAYGLPSPVTELAAFGLSGQAPSTVPSVTVEPFTGRDFLASWPVTPGCAKYVVELWSGASLKRSVTQVETRIAYTQAQATTDGGPFRSLEVRVYGVGPDGVTLSSTYASASATNAAPAAQTITATGGVGNFSVTVPMVMDPDMVGYIVWASTTAGFSPSDANKVYDGPSNKVTVEKVGGTDVAAPTTYYVRAAAYDVFGKTGLNISSQVSVVPASLGSVIDDGSLTLAKFAAGIQPIGIVSALPDPVGYNGAKVVLLSSDSSLWRYTGSGWVSSNQVYATDVIGQISSDQLAAGAVTAAQQATGKHTIY